MKRLLATAVLLVLLLPLSAEDQVLTVDQAVEMALENNLSLQMSGIDLKTKHRTMETWWNRFIPTVTASVDLTWSDNLFGENEISTGFSLVERDPTTALQAGVSMVLPINMALGNGIRILMLDYESGKLSYEKASRELEVNIKKQFWAIQMQKAGVELQTRNIATLEKRYNQAKINFENGLVPELAVLSARVSLENQRPSLLKQQAALEDSKNLLKFLVGIPREDNLSLEGELKVDHREFDSEKLISDNLFNRLDIQSIQYQLKIAENGKSADVFMNYSPNLVLKAIWGTGVDDKPFESNSWDPMYDNFSLGIGLQIPLDGLIPGSQKANQVKGDQDGIDSLKLAERQLIENAAMEITRLVKQLKTSEITLDAYSYNVELAEKNFRLNNEAYELGTVELLEVESAQDQLFQAEFSVISETYNYLSTLLDLELALNSRLEEM